MSWLNTSRAIKSLGILIVIAVASPICFAVMSTTSAVAESPSPNWDMTDVNTYNGYPFGYNAGIIDANAPGCNSTPYTPSAVESEAISWIKNQHQTMIMLDMQSTCDTNVGDYEALASNIEGAIKAGLSSPGYSGYYNRYFYGFMVDEEPWFWTSAGAAATAYSSFNSWLLSNTANIPFSELANAAGWWTQAQYNSVGWYYSWSAPQVYNARTQNNQNTLTGSYGGYDTLVTCYPGQYGYPYDTCADAASVINGAPWTYSTWGGGAWYNQFEPS